MNKRLIDAIRAITVDAKNDQPNGEFETELLRLGHMLDPNKWPINGTRREQLRYLSEVNGVCGKMCNALANEVKELREAASETFPDVDFKR